ncbi:MAG: DUF2147 domain-containing protein [Alphaproteobacteria bacterium]|nr:DUF2147 domain-containing protein [Alphaproteobacteria bacterium]
MRRVTSRNIIGAMGLLFATAAGQVARADEGGKNPILGLWDTQEGGIVEIYSCGAETICGRVFCDTAAGNNPDSSVTVINDGSPSQCGKQIIKDLKPDGKGGYDSGSITDIRPDSITSKMTATLSAKLESFDTLELCGYFGFSFFGQTRTWKRVNSPPKHTI